MNSAQKNSSAAFLDLFLLYHICSFPATSTKPTREKGLSITLNETEKKKKQKQTFMLLLDVSFKNPYTR